MTRTRRREGIREEVKSREVRKELGASEVIEVEVAEGEAN